MFVKPVSVVVLCREYVCCRLMAGFAGSDTAEGVGDRLLCLLCVV